MFETIMLSSAVMFFANGMTNAELQQYQGSPFPGWSKWAQECFLDHTKYYGCPKIKCEAFQEVVQTTHKFALGTCDRDWHIYEKRVKEHIEKGDLVKYSQQFPDRNPYCWEKQIIRRRLIGMCDDGVVRWSDRKERP